MKEDYLVLNTNEWRKIMKKGKANFKYQMEENMALVYQIDDGRVLLFPAVNSDQGILFRDENTLKKVISIYGIPLEEKEYNPFVTNKDFILKIPESINNIIKKFEDKYNIVLPLSINENQMAETSAYIRELLINKMLEYRYKYIYFPIGIYIHELIRLKIKGNWELEKNFGINPYYIPYIVDEKSIKYRAWKGILDIFEEPKSFNIIKCFQLTITKPIGKVSNIL